MQVQQNEQELDDRLLKKYLELAERYAETMPQLEQEVNEYEQRVKEHLKVMGFEL